MGKKSRHGKEYRRLLRPLQAEPVALQDLPHLPAAGEVVIFDRSWYNWAGLERVMGFRTDEQARHFLGPIPTVEREIVDSVVIMLEYRRHHARVPAGGRATGPAGRQRVSRPTAAAALDSDAVLRIRAEGKDERYGGHTSGVPEFVGGSAGSRTG
ncbi:hypothetical protein B7C42_00716 [Nocardia cerradoensis]|uniref:Polyphosphate kinase-2-related domain-containing protein n=1 Tax=Nocardia cerradoensis TaxID=85688 RepID=A0A231HF41_9NOCA|nr:hypothetical protein B7C42_00716 [Nocardia cerradoensis]